MQNGISDEILSLFHRYQADSDMAMERIAAMGVTPAQVRNVISELVEEDRLSLVEAGWFKRAVASYTTQDMRPNPDDDEDYDEEEEGIEIKEVEGPFPWEKGGKRKNPNDFVWRIDDKDLENHAQQYVQLMHDHMSGELVKKYYAHFLEHGEKFTWSGEKIPSRYKEGRRYQVKQCYKNAQTLATYYPDELTYYEGYGVNIIPVEHAWVVEKATGKVFDPTWEHCSESNKRHDYFGVAVPAKLVYKNMLTEKTYCPIVPNLLFRGLGSE
jgi:hypothetical protein